VKGAPAHAPKVLLAHQPRSAPFAEAAATPCSSPGTRTAASSGVEFPGAPAAAVHRGLNRLGRMWSTLAAARILGTADAIRHPSEITLIHLVANRRSKHADPQMVRHRGRAADRRGHRVGSSVPAGTPPTDLGVRDGKLKPPSMTRTASPARPRSTRSPQRKYAEIAPLPVKGEGPVTIAQIKAIVEGMDAQSGEERAWLSLRAVHQQADEVRDDVEFWFDPRRT